MAKQTSETVVPTRQGVLPLLEHLARMGRRAYENELVPGGLRPRHLIALKLLGDHGPQSQQGLAEGLSLDPSNVVGLLNELEERALIVRRRDRADRRRHIVELSAAGEEEVSLANARVVVVEDQLLAGLSGNERTVLFELLERAIGTATPPCDASDHA
jgi:MarR family transcriptional regulator, lower aerobic nicotinate degradation pathway regulator